MSSLQDLLWPCQPVEKGSASLIWQWKGHYRDCNVGKREQRGRPPTRALKWLCNVMKGTNIEKMRAAVFVLVLESFQQMFQQMRKRIKKTRSKSDKLSPFIRVVQLKCIVKAFTCTAVSSLCLFVDCKNKKNQHMVALSGRIAHSHISSSTREDWLKVLFITHCILNGR